MRLRDEGVEVGEHGCTSEGGIHKDTKVASKMFEAPHGRNYTRAMIDSKSLQQAHGQCTYMTVKVAL